MTIPWRKLAIEAIVMTLAGMMALSGSALAAIADVNITSPTTLSPAYHHPGEQVVISGTFRAEPGDLVYVRGSVGSNTGAYSGPLTASGGDDPFSYTVVLDASEPQGWKNVSVDAYTVGSPVMSDTERIAVCVDSVAPVIDDTSWNPADGSTINDQTTLTVTVGVSDAAPSSGIDTSSIVAAVTGGGAVDSATYDAGTGLVTIQLSGLTYGSHTLLLDLSDNAGNAATQQSMSFTIGDTVAPVIDDTSWSTAEGSWITSNSLTVTVDVSDAAPSSGINASSVSASVTGGTVDSATYDAVTGKVTIAMSGLSEGSHTLSLRLSDNAGNAATQQTLNFGVDTVAPVIDDLSWNPADGSTFDDQTALTVTVSVSDATSGIDTTSIVAAVTGGGTVASATYDAVTGKVTIQLSGLTYGSHTLSLDLSDNAGNAATQQSMTFNIGDTVAPVIDDTSWSTAEGSWITSNSLTVTVDVSDAAPSSGINASSVSASVTGGTVDSATYDAVTGKVTIAMSGLSEGSHTLSLRLSDNAGNAATQQTLNFNVDWNPPTKPGMPSPASSPTTDTTPVWTWAGSEDEISGVDYYQIQIRRSGSSDWDVLDTPLDIVDNLTPGDQTWEQALPLESGSYVIRVRAWDVAGNYSEWSDEGTVEVDVNPVAAPAIAALYEGYNTSPIPIDWNDVVDGSNAISYVLEWADNAGFAGATSVDCAGSEYSFDAAAAGEGEYWFRVKTVSTVNVGETKESGWSAVVSTTYDTTGPDAPEVTLMTPSPTNEVPQIWTWSRPADAVRYDFGESADGVTPPATFTNVGNVDTYETNFTSDGTHYVMVRAYDALGNAGDWSAAASVVIDMTPPGVPTDLAVPSPTNDNTPTWTWTASTGDVASYEVSLDGAAPVNVGNVTSYTPSALADGRHNLKVRALDALGNASDWAGPAEVLVDTVAPVITLINPESGARLNITTASTILADLFDSGSGIDETKVRLRIDGGEWVAPTAIVGGTLYYVVNLPFEATDDKWHSLDIKAEDAVGNKASVSASFKVELYREGFGFGRLRFPEESD